MVAATTGLPDNIFDAGGRPTSSEVPSSPLPSSILPPSGSVSESILVTATGPPPVPSSPTSSSSIVTSASLASQTSNVAAATSSATTVKTGTLTTPQIAGIAVAGVASASVAFGIMLFLYCLRRRRALKHQSEQLPFEIEKAPPKQNPSDPPPPPPKDVTSGNADVANVAPVIDRAPKVPPKDSAKRRSFWRRTIKSEDIGVAVSPETPHQASPKSVASYRTTSRLLPDKPVYTLWPRATRMTQYNRPESTETRFEEDLDGGRRGFLNLPMHAARGRVPMDPSRRPAQPRYVQNKHYAQEYPVDSRELMYARERGSHRRRPSLPTHIRPVLEESPEILRTVSPYRVERLSTLRHPTSLTPGPYHPRNIAQSTSVPPTTRSSNYSGSYSLASSKEQQMKRPIQSHHPAFRRSMSTQPTMRFSSASDTSFESTGEDDETPPADPALSPVAESPHRSPISALKYPTIPRSAAITKTAGAYLPRREGGRDALDHAVIEIDNERDQSPTPKKRDGSPSSLLAKRRGDKAAGELEKALKIRQNDNVRAQSNTKWRVVNTPGVENATLDQKSQAWEPKLTPTKRDGGLYLEVQ
ncbi:hypothetical protein MMC16_005132 [Acarospora aff. strigata]|nr:hypothetical protein [Acarospora aff. strigata]